MKKRPCISTKYGKIGLLPIFQTPYLWLYTTQNAGKSLYGLQIFLRNYNLKTLGSIFESKPSQKWDTLDPVKTTKIQKKIAKTAIFLPNQEFFQKSYSKLFCSWHLRCQQKKVQPSMSILKGVKPFLRLLGGSYFGFFWKSYHFSLVWKCRNLTQTKLFHNFTLTLKINFNLLKVENGFEMVLLTFYYVFKRRICKKRHHFILINTIFDQ